jgi:hypothetical protein
MPLLGVERFLGQDTSPFGCDEVRKLPTFIKNLRNNPPTHHRTILLAGRFAAIEPSDNIFADRRGHLQFSGPRITDGTVNLDAVFQTGLHRTLAAITELPNTTVVFVDQVPELDFMPMNCNRLQLFQSLEGSTCTTAQIPIDAMFTRYKINANAILAKYPLVKRYDPMNTLCANNQCMIMNNGNALYIDTNHLTLYGAQIVDAALWKTVFGQTIN